MKPAIAILGVVAATVAIAACFPTSRPPPPSNPIIPQAIKISKDVVGTPPAGDFLIRTDCNDGTSKQIDVTGGDYEYVDAREGAVCTVTETDSLGASSSVVSGSPCVITDANYTNECHVTVTNTFP